MLTFKERLHENQIKNLTDRQRDAILGYTDEYGAENMGYCLVDGAVIVRLFSEGGYSFCILRGGEESLCDLVSSVAEYAVKEETGLVFTGVLPSELGEIISSFNYAEVCTLDPERSEYTVRVKSEADRISASVFADGGRMTLSLLGEGDISEYARLCRDESALEFWGYDYRDDGENISDEYFYNMQKAEFERGTSLSLAVRIDGKFAGEGSFYAFDYKGGAQISFRLLPEYRGCGFGRMLLEMLLSFAEELSLTALYAAVDKNNTPSLKLISEYMDKTGEEENRLYFALMAE